jgi:DNA modification methylase
MPHIDHSHQSPVRDRIVELIRIRASELEPNPANWRRHPEEQRSALRGLLEEIGYADALLARRDGERLVLIDGHLRQSLDSEQLLPVLVLDVTEQEAETLLATLDPITALARADPEALSTLLARVEAADADVRLLLERVARDAGARPRLQTDPDEISVATPARVQPGDLWSVGSHRLLCGDATDAADVERLLAEERADALWTDPPYGVGYVGKTARAMTIAGDGPAGLGDLLRRAFAAVGPILAPGAAIYLCHQSGEGALDVLKAFRDQGWRLHQTLIWAKDGLVLGHTDYHYRHEPIAYGFAPGGGRRGRGGTGWYGGDAEDSIFEIARPTASHEHPTMKPVELVARCLRNSSRPGERVLDPFGGSGTTLIAAETLGRKGYAIEIDPGYCDVAIARLEALTGLEAKLEYEGSRVRRGMSRDHEGAVNSSSKARTASDCIDGNTWE